MPGEERWDRGTRGPAVGWAGGSGAPGWADQAEGARGCSVAISEPPGLPAPAWLASKLSVGAAARETASGETASEDSTAADTAEGDTAVVATAVVATAVLATAVVATADAETVSLETVSTALRNSCSNWLEADWKPLRVLPRVLPSSGRRLGPNTSRPMAAITAISGRPIPKIFIVSKHRWVDPALTRPGRWSNNQRPRRAWDPG